MKRLLLTFTLFLAPSAFANGFLYEEETGITKQQIGDVTYMVLEQFRDKSIEPAEMVAIEDVMVTVVRDEKVAILIPAKFFSLYMSSGKAFKYAENQCASECNASAIAGLIGGALGGAASGATIGTAGGPGGAVGGAVVGGFIGGVAGGMTGWEACRITTQCDKSETKQPLQMTSHRS